MLPVDTNQLSDQLIKDGWVKRELSGFIGVAGPLWTKRDGTSWLYGMLLEEKHMNPAGRCHGGALMSLMDHAMSTVAWEECARTPCVTIQFDSRFFSAASAGSFVSVNAKVLKKTGSLVFAQAHMNQDGGLLMTAQAVLKRLEIAPS